MTSFCSDLLRKSASCNIPRPSNSVRLEKTLEILPCFLVQLDTNSQNISNMLLEVFSSYHLLVIFCFFDTVSKKHVAQFHQSQVLVKLQPFLQRFGFAQRATCWYVAGLSFNLLYIFPLMQQAQLLRDSLP